MSALNQIKQAEAEATARIQEAEQTAATQVAAAGTNLQKAVTEETERLESWLQQERATARAQAQAEAVEIAQTAQRAQAELKTQAERNHTVAVSAAIHAFTLDSK